ncbi:MAG TPA: tRNA epoxyqueuosine(34) reductase QueG [Steroidobacteraceae bacterium]|jgi:epoxyqueuosine reductase|nr:tRNA epoxyqueuosine(34) reductase QueG [Steroidobacteraceae bacterium]
MTASALPAARFDPAALMTSLRAWASELGFTGIGVAGIDLPADEAFFLEWLQAGFNGEMGYMARHGSKRSRPAELIPGTVSCISVRMDYWPQASADAAATLTDGNVGYVSRYALGRDYHKVLRSRLQRLCERIQAQVGPFGHRVFTDSAPVLEKALARNARLGWIGKHTNLIDRNAGSYFFLGEIYLDLQLPVDEPSTAHCGTCSACMPACPTGAIVAPYRLDARRCISYLTIELAGSIPVEFRAAIGNRIYGCDDCQLVCPWNKFARPTGEKDFAVRHGLDQAQLTDLFAWSEADFLEKTRGSAIRRIGYERWLRNIAVALGNAPGSSVIVAALQARAQHPSALVREHAQWALAQQQSRAAAVSDDAVRADGGT